MQTTNLSSVMLVSPSCNSYVEDGLITVWTNVTLKWFCLKWCFMLDNNARHWKWGSFTFFSNIETRCNENMKWLKHIADHQDKFLDWYSIVFGCGQFSLDKRRKNPKSLHQGVPDFQHRRREGEDRLMSSRGSNA